MKTAGVEPPPYGIKIVFPKITFSEIKSFGVWGIFSKIPLKNSTLPVFEKRCLNILFKGVNNPSGGAQNEINEDIFGEKRASLYKCTAVEAFRQSP